VNLASARPAKFTDRRHGLPQTLQIRTSPGAHWLQCSAVLCSGHGGSFSRPNVSWPTHLFATRTFYLKLSITAESVIDEVGWAPPKRDLAQATASWE
jgi:hypothetical protein